MYHEGEVRLIAYELWEREGRPDGKDLEHWHQAEAIWAERQSPEQAETETPEKPVLKRTRRTTAARRRTASRRPSK